MYEQKIYYNKPAQVYFLSQTLKTTQPNKHSVCNIVWCFIVSSFGVKKKHLKRTINYTYQNTL